MAKIIVSGSLAYDQIMDYPGLFKDYFLTEKLHNINLSFAVNKITVGFGGTAGNVAYNLALLGEEPEIVATVGDDFDRFRAHLSKLGVDLSKVKVLQGELTAAAYVMTDKADNQITAFHYGAGSHPYEEVVETEGRTLALISPGCIEDMERFAKDYKKQNFRYLYDPGQQITLLKAEALKIGIDGAEILFVSDYELGLILEKLGWTEEELLKHVPTLVVTFGAEGSRISSKDGEWRIKAVSAPEAVDPTGAGDAYRAGFIKGIVSGFSLEMSGKLASTVAAYAVEKHGTQIHRFSIEGLKARYQSAYNEPLPL